MKKFLPLLSIILLLLFSGCSKEEKQEQEVKELLIYCGITMAKPIKEIAEIIERKHHCKITIMQGASEDLYQSLAKSKKGDLYLPGSASYRTTHLSEGYLKEYVDVGYNRAAIIVPKGNPKKSKGDLKELKNPQNIVVLCDPESGSIGKETKKILEKAGIYNDVFTNVTFLTTDSRNINKMFVQKRADMAINWYATTTWPENSESVESIAIDPFVAQRKILRLNLLSFSKHPDIAKAFMDYAVSEEGETVFYRYGFLEKSDFEQNTTK